MCSVAGTTKVVVYTGCRKVREVIMIGIADTTTLTDGKVEFTRATTLSNGSKLSGALKAVMRCKFQRSKMNKATAKNSCPSSL